MRKSLPIAKDEAVSSQYRNAAPLENHMNAPFIPTQDISFMNKKNSSLPFCAGSMSAACRFLKSGAVLIAALSIGAPLIHATGIVLDTGDVTIAPTGILDLKVNNLIVRGPGGGASDYFKIAGYVASGFNSFGQNGFGIHSSAAAADPNFVTAVGVLDNSQFFYADFQGHTGLIGDETLAKYTYFGDADLTGEVTDDDQVLLDFGRSFGVNEWWAGDFNYSGLVDDDDQVLLDFGRSTQVYGVLVSQGSLEAAAVPEPGTFGLISFGFISLLSRRQKRRQKN